MLIAIRLCPPSEKLAVDFNKLRWELSESLFDIMLCLKRAEILKLDGYPAKPRLQESVYLCAGDI